MRESRHRDNERVRVRDTWQREKIYEEEREAEYETGRDIERAREREGKQREI